MTDLSAHPCFGGQGSLRFGRLHIPAAPSCNLRCAFCGGGVDNGETPLPGRTTKIVSPQEVEAYASQSLREHPEITVLGIAGPGEPLFHPQTFEILEKLHRCFPDKLLCVGTNGSLLPQNVERLSSLGVKTLTVTVNALSPQVCSQLSPWMDGPFGEEGGRLLVERQLEGISRAASCGMRVKINTVLIPGINDGEIRAVAEAVRQRGAAIQNIMPLHPAGRLIDHKAPTSDQLYSLRSELSVIIPQLHSCTQCRADACGLLGENEEGYGCAK